MRDGGGISKQYGFKSDKIEGPKEVQDDATRFDMVVPEIKEVEGEDPMSDKQLENMEKEAALALVDDEIKKLEKARLEFEDDVSIRSIREEQGLSGPGRMTKEEYQEKFNAFRNKRNELLKRREEIIGREDYREAA